MTTDSGVLPTTPEGAAITSNANNATPALEALVGDSKKFKTVEDLAKGKLESDAFILKLQEETQTLRSLLEQTEVNKTRETLLQEILQTMNDNTNPGTIQTNDTTTTTSNQPPQQLSLEDIVKVIEQREEQRQELNNFNQAMDKVKEVYGDRSDEFVENRAKELSVSVDELKAMAKKSPKAFLTMVGVAAGKQQAAPLSGVNSQAVLGSQQSSGTRNKAYYDKLQAEMGGWKFATNRNLQIQLHKDMQALGDAWYS